MQVLLFLTTGSYILCIIYAIIALVVCIVFGLLYIFDGAGLYPPMLLHV